MYTDPDGHREAVDSKLSLADQIRIGYLTASYLLAKASYSTSKDSKDLKSAEDARRAAVAIRKSSGKIDNYVDTYKYTTKATIGNSKCSYSKGSSGSAVQKIQTALVNKGYSVGAKGADSNFGTDTQGAVIRYQIDNGLYYDGVVGSKTSSSLFEKDEVSPNIMLSKKRNERPDSGLSGLSDDEVSRRARDNSLSGQERRKYQTEEKLRGLRNKQKRQSQYNNVEPTNNTEPTNSTVPNNNTPMPIPVGVVPKVASQPEPTVNFYPFFVMRNVYYFIKSTSSNNLN